MKFCIISAVVHKESEGLFYGYEPYVREMNLWLKYIDELVVVAPSIQGPANSVELPYQHKNITFLNIPSFDITSLVNTIKAVFLMPIIFYKIFRAMKSSDHIHLRCPANISLLGCLVQILFPKKPKTIKYAGNWDPNSKQPLSYRIQKKIISNTFLTKNAKVLVYGEWENQSKNIVPFFTASFSENEICINENKNLNDQIKFLFVGALTKGKQPLLSLKSVHRLYEEGCNVRLDIYGEGTEMQCVKDYVEKHSLNEIVVIHGNQSKTILKKAYRDAHFLIFISKSEGWPKVVAESMFYSCLPISSNVSCIPYMLGYGERGSIITNTNVNEIVKEIKFYIDTPKVYEDKILKANVWSNKFTLEFFEREIKKILIDK